MQDPLATLSIITLWLMALLTDDDYSRESLCLKSFILYKELSFLRHIGDHHLDHPAFFKARSKMRAFHQLFTDLKNDPY